MLVNIIGPNLRDQSKGSYHVHAAGCADIARRYRDDDGAGIDVEVASRCDAPAHLPRPRHGATHAPGEVDPAAPYGPHESACPLLPLPRTARGSRRRRLDDAMRQLWGDDMSEWRCTCKRETGDTASCPAHGGAAPELTARNRAAILAQGLPDPPTLAETRGDFIGPVRRPT